NLTRLCPWTFHLSHISAPAHVPSNFHVAEHTSLRVSGTAMVAPLQPSRCSACAVNAKTKKTNEIITLIIIAEREGDLVLAFGTPFRQGHIRGECGSLVPFPDRVFVRLRRRSEAEPHIR